MKTIALVPARGGSKRFPGKNIYPFLGSPLLVHSIRYAQAQPQIDQIIVSTDDEDIARVARKHGAEVIWRPMELAGDYEPTITAVVHAWEELGQPESDWVLLQATNPLRPIDLFQHAWNTYLDTDRKGLFTVTRSWEKLGKIENERFVPYNYLPGQRSQDLEPLYYENGLLYITPSHLLAQDKLLDENAIPLEVNHMYTRVDIDTPTDFQLAEAIARLKLEQYAFNTSQVCVEPAPQQLPKLRKLTSLFKK